MRVAVQRLMKLHKSTDEMTDGFISQGIADRIKRVHEPRIACFVEFRELRDTLFESRQGRHYRHVARQAVESHVEFTMDDVFVDTRQRRPKPAKLTFQQLLEGHVWRLAHLRFFSEYSHKIATFIGRLDYQ